VIVLVGSLLVARYERGNVSARTAKPAGTSASAPAPVPKNSMAGMVHPTLAAFQSDAPTLQPEGWTAQASSQLAGNPPLAALDDHATTYWNSNPANALPQSITIDMRGPETVSGLNYQPRQDTPPTGVIGQFEVSVSSDGANFTTAASGTWANTTDTKNIGIAPVTTRFVRLTALSYAAGSGSSVAAAGISLQGAPHVQAPTSNAPINGPNVNASTNPSVVGQWGTTIGFPLVPSAAALLPNNKILVWSADENMSFGDGSNLTQTAILDLNTGQVSPNTVSNTNHNMFCPGVAILPNGDILVTGGLSSSQTSIYHVATNTWTAGPQMNVGRGYQGQTLLSNGQVFTLGGSWSGALGGKLGEVYSANAGWRELTNVPATPIYTADPQGVYRQDNHGWFIATGGGNVFHAGPSKQMNWITTAGAGSITSAGNRGSSGDAMNGNAVLYDIGKILTLGGAPAYESSNATNQANVIDISSGTAKVTATGSMSSSRAFVNSVVLPNGQVVAMGGQNFAVPFSDDTSVLNAEIWDPTSGQFSVMAPEAVPRNYHSVGLLLPDGRVFSGGGGLCGTCSTNHPDGQIFSPPYLFNADGSLRTRPTISSAPTSATTGQTISVTTGGPVSSFTMMRYGEATHSVDNDQRRIPLSIVSSSGNTYQLAIPSDPGIALPGPYMLFAMDANGTPSVSSTISITNVASQPPTNNYGKAVFNAGPSSYWPLNDPNGPWAVDASGNGDAGNYSPSGVTYGVASPVETSSGKGVTLDGANGQIVASQPTTNPTTYSEQMWFKTTTTQGGYLMGFGTSPSGTSVSRDRQVWMSNSGQLNFGIYDNTPISIQSPRSYNDGQWHQVVATDGPTALNLYVDGQVVSNLSTTSPPQPYLGYWRVGYEDASGWNGSPTNNHFAGTISDVAFYNVELSSAQVSSQYSQSGVQGAPPACPTGWSCTDINGALPAGQDSLNAQGVWSEVGGGGDIWATSDAFHFVSQSVTGDTTLSAHVTAQQATDPWSKAGVMLRASTAAGSPYYAVFVTPANGIVVQWRATSGASTNQVGIAGTVPKYLRVARLTSGTTTSFTAYTSSDNNTWTAVGGSTQTLNLGQPLLAGLAITSHNQGTGSAVTLDTVSITGGAPPPPPPPGCPTGWSCADVGGALPAGQDSLNAQGVWSEVGGGGDIWATSDAFHLVSQSINGDTTVSAHVTAQQATDPWSKAGVMLRATTDPGSPYYAVFVTPANGIVVQWRATQAATTNQVAIAGTVPKYLRVARLTSGTTTSFTAYTSSDNNTWTAVGGSTQTLNLGQPLLAGLAITSHNQGAGSAVTLDTVSITGGAPPPPPPPGCPTGWSCADIGGALPAGQDALNGQGVWSEVGGGGDIWATSDAFHLVSQSVTGDTTVSAHVTAQQATDPWSKAGVMLRATTDPGSPYYAVFVTPANGIAVQWRATQAATTNQVAIAGAVPAYLRIARSTSGTTTSFTAYTSPDGTNWTPVAGSTQTLSLGQPLLAGLAITSHNQGTGSAVTLDTVSVVAGAPGPPNSCPTGWTCADIGAPTPAGGQALSSGTWTIQGGGGDIWATSDSFHYIWNSLAADGTISAQVTSQTNSDPWAKAGVMLRLTNAANAPYYAVFVTPGNGIAVQWRTAAGAATSQVAIAGTTAIYLRITRTGTTFTAATSPNGTTWTNIAGSSISVPNLTGALLRGLAVTSHNTGAISTVVMNAVVTP
jgi:galactose oxidase